MKIRIYTLLLFITTAGIYHAKAQTVLTDSFNSIASNPDYFSKFYTQNNWKIITINKPNYSKTTSYMYQTVVPGNENDPLRFPIIQFQTTSSKKIATVTPTQYNTPVVMMTQDHESAYQFQKKTSFQLFGNNGTMFHYFLKQTDIMRKNLEQPLKKGICYKFYVTVWHPKCHDTISTGNANWSWVYTQSEYLQKEFVPDIILARDSNIKWEYLDSATGVQNHFVKAVCTNAYINGTLNQWVTLEYTYQATGHENYVFLGSVYPNIVAYPVLNKFLGQTLDDEKTTLTAMMKSTSLRAVTLFSRFEMVELPPIKLINDTVLCTKQDLVLKDLNYNKQSSYSWSSGIQNPQTIASTQGTYILKKTTGICVEKDTVNIQIIDKSNYSLEGNSRFCDGDSVVIKVKNPLQGVNYTWNNGHQGVQYTAMASGNYVLTLNAAKCTLKDSLQVEKINMPLPPTFTDTIFCAAVLLHMDLSSNADAILWEDNNSTQKIRDINKKGTYNLQLINANFCKINHIIHVDLLNKPSIPFNDTILPCAGEKVVFENKDLKTKYTWNQTNNSNIYEVKSTEIIKINAVNFCGAAEKEVTVEIGNKLCGLYIPTAFTPNNDGLNDEFKLESSLGIENLKIEIYNQWGQKIFEETNIRKGWNGKTANNTECANGVYAVFVSGTLAASEASFSNSSTLHLLR